MDTHGRAPRDGASVVALIAALALLSLLAFVDIARAADGDLDSAFGAGGYTLTGLTGASLLVPPKPVVQPDGKIVYCSLLSTGGASGDDFFIARFNADGTLDTSFDFDGKVTVDFGGRLEGCTALAVQADGKIIAVGSSRPAVIGVDYDFAAVRLDADGSLDPTFGNGGKVREAFDLGGNNTDEANAVALQADGKIVIAGWASTASHGDDFAILRLLPDGSRDTAFNLTGRVTVGFDFPGSVESDEADAVVIDDEGRILVGGAASTAPNGSDFALARLLPNGQLDASFDADGRATLGFDLGATNSDPAFQTILQRDGRIVMVGQADTGSGMTSNLDTAVARLLPDGSPDMSFGIGGKVLIPYDLVAGGLDLGWGVVEDPVGRIVVVGGAVSGAMNSLATVARLRSDGSLDPTFGTLGKKIIDFGFNGQALTGVALQGTQLIVAGQVTGGTDGDNVVARLEVDLLFADGFE